MVSMMSNVIPCSSTHIVQDSLVQQKTHLKSAFSRQSTAEPDAFQQVAFSRQTSTASELFEPEQHPCDEENTHQFSWERASLQESTCLQSSHPQTLASTLHPLENTFHETKQCKLHVKDVCCQGPLCRFARNSGATCAPPTCLYPASDTAGVCDVRNLHLHNFNQPRKVSTSKKQRARRQAQQNQEQQNRKLREEEKHRRLQNTWITNPQQQKQMQQTPRAQIILLDESLGMSCAPRRMQDEFMNLGAAPFVEPNGCPKTMQDYAVQECDKNSGMRSSDVTPAASLNMKSKVVQEPPKSQKNARAMRNMFYKTQLCRHFATGNCGKGSSCNFVHSVEEFKHLPNLLHTKMCRALIETGTCSNENCTFAHHEHELRKVRHHQSGGARNKGNLSRNPHGQTTSIMHAQCDCSMTFKFKDEVLVVKNTFLDVQESTPHLGLPRSKSLPSLKPRILLA